MKKKNDTAHKRYFINLSTKGHRTLHIYDNPQCYYSKSRFEYEEYDSVEEAMSSIHKPQKCKICFRNE